MTLTEEEFAAFARALEEAPNPTEKLRVLMREPVKLWDETLEEPIDDFKELLAKLK